jgi:two-component system cell cycle response regulator
MNKPTILVVDDSHLNVELIEGALSRDYNIIKAYGGVEALTMAEKTCPDLILLDIMMPDMNGYMVCKELKRSNKTNWIPVIMVTALNKDTDKMNAIDSNADDFVNKPLDMNVLRMKINAWLKIKNRGNLEIERFSNTNLYKVF